MDVVIDTCRFTGAVAQTGLNIQNTKIAWDNVVSEYQSTGKVSFLNAGNLALSALGVGIGAKSISGAAKKVSKYASRGMQKATSLSKSGSGSDNLLPLNLQFFGGSTKSGTETRVVKIQK